MLRHLVQFLLNARKSQDFLKNPLFLGFSGVHIWKFGTIYTTFYKNIEKRSQYDRTKTKDFDYKAEKLANAKKYNTDKDTVAKSSDSGTINPAEPKEEINVHTVGKIDKEFFEQHFGKLKTDEVIVTDERTSETVYMIKKVDNENLNVVLKLILEKDIRDFKNFVITFWSIRDSNVDKLEKKNKVLYKKE